MRDRKDLEKRNAAPLENTPTTREFLDANRARILYAQNELKPLRVCYSDGATAQFRYSHENELTDIIERNGTSWSCVSPPDSKGFSQWRSSDGQHCRLKFSVLSDGTYQREDPSGVIETVATGFKRHVEKAFPVGFDAVQLLKSVFQTVDKNLDKTLTRMELDAALAAHSANREHVTLFAMLRLYFDEIIRTRDDPMLIEAGGLTVTDLERFQKLKEREHKTLGAVPPFLREFFENLFATIDVDRDGMTTLDEIAQTCRVPTGNSAQEFGTAQQSINDDTSLRAQMAEFGVELAPAVIPEPTIKQSSKESSPPCLEVSSIVGHFLQNQDSETLRQIGIHDRSDWIYKTTFMQLCELACAEHTSQRVLTGGWLYDEQKSAASIPQNIFKDPANAAECVRVEAVTSGTLGDPVFLAALAGFVSANPPAILRALRQDPAKTCTVSFPGAPAAPITMAWLTTLEIYLYQNSTAYGIWSAFMQKAYEIHLALNDLPRSPVPAADSILDTTNLPFELLTGKQCGWRLFSHMHHQEVEDLIAQNLQLRLPVLVTTGPLESWINGVRIVPSNVMALTRFNKQTSEVVLQDPLSSVCVKSPGTRLDGNNSVLTIKLEQLFKHFLALSITL